MRTTKVTIAQKTYTIEELPRKRSADWRKKLQEELSGLVELLEAAPGALENKNPRGLLLPTTVAAQQLLGSIDAAFELLLAYAPHLQRDRERLEEEAFDSEIIDAFMAVLGLAYPFGAAAGRLLSLSSSGSKTLPTIPN